MGVSDSHVLSIMWINFVDSNPKIKCYKIQKSSNNALLQIGLRHGLNNPAQSTFSGLGDVFWRASDLISKLQQRRKRFVQYLLSLRKICQNMGFL